MSGVNDWDTFLASTEKHVGSRLLHTLPVMEQYVLQEHTASAMITINATVSYFPTLHCHSEVFKKKNADTTLKAIQWLEYVEVIAWI